MKKNGSQVEKNAFYELQSWIFTIRFGCSKRSLLKGPKRSRPRQCSYVRYIVTSQQVVFDIDPFVKRPSGGCALDKTLTTISLLVSASKNNKCLKEYIIFNIMWLVGSTLLHHLKPNLKCPFMVQCYFASLTLS